MRYSLEARVPLLDHRIINFALNLSPGLKNGFGSDKYILKKVLFNYLPAQLFERPKQGFGIPLGKWLNGEMGYLIDKYLNPEMIGQYGIVWYPIVRKYIERFRKGESYLYNRIWALIILHWWMHKNQSE